jgi:hypothetical protein
VTPAVIVAHEGCDSRLEVGGQPIWHLVYVSLDTLLIALQLAIGLKVKGGCQNVPDAHHGEIVPEYS